MIIVSDTTPISELAKVGRLHLLADLFGTVIIPPQVFEELSAGNHPAAAVVSQLDWLDIREVDATSTQSLMQLNNLDLGESAAIILAEALKAEQLLIDERAARKVARSRNLPVIGTVGLLILAKQRGLIESVKTELNALMSNGMRLSEQVYQDALMLAQEPFSQ